MKEVKIVLPSGKTHVEIIKLCELTRGKTLIEKVFKNLNIVGDSQNYFGLFYASRKDGGINWINPDDNIKHSELFAKTLHFSVRIFPQEPDLSLSTNEARFYFRNHCKNMLAACEIGCCSKTHAMLDSFIAQAEMGDFKDGNKQYFQRLNDIEIYSPSELTTNEQPISEVNYLRLVRTYHKQLYGTRQTQADILFLSLFQKLPLYGLQIFKVTEKKQDTSFVALSFKGLYFIHDACLEKVSGLKCFELFTWSELVYNEVNNNQLKLGLYNKTDIFVERKFKMKSKFGNHMALQFHKELEKHKQLFASNAFTNKKQATRGQMEKIPSNSNSLSRRISSFRTSFRRSVKRNPKEYDKYENDRQNTLLNVKTRRFKSE